MPQRVQELADELKRTRKQLEKALAPDFDLELEKIRAAAVEFIKSIARGYMVLNSVISSR